MLVNEDIFLQLYSDIRSGKSVEDICKNYGGSNIYIPSFKSMGRNEEIQAEYKKRIEEGADNVKTIRALATEYSLSYAHIYKIVTTPKPPIQPTLF
jgi:Mor family transcriptional regulator